MFYVQSGRATYGKNMTFLGRILRTHTPQRRCSLLHSLVHSFLGNTAPHICKKEGKVFPATSCISSFLRLASGNKKMVVGFNLQMRRTGLDKTIYFCSEDTIGGISFLSKPRTAISAYTTWPENFLKKKTSFSPSSNWHHCHLGGLTTIYLSLICMTVRIGWTDYHTFVSYLYDSKAWVDWLPYICLLFSGFSNVYHSVRVSPTALELGCVTNLDMLFLVMEFISLVNEIQFMLIRSIAYSTNLHNLQKSRPLVLRTFNLPKTQVLIG